MVTFTINKDLQKKLNVTLWLISDWFQINQIVLNKNKTFAINFSVAKTLNHTLNIILHNQKLTLTESIKFFGMHLDSNLSQKLHVEKLLKN